MTDVDTGMFKEQWAVHARARADALKEQVGVATAAGDLTPRQEACAQSVRDLLTKTRKATRRNHSWWPFRGVLDRWRGASIQAAYLNLHAAEVLMVDLLTDEEVDTRAPAAVAHAVASLEPNDPRKQHIQWLPRVTDMREKRARLAHTLEIGYDASDTLHVRVRDFRNVLLVTALLIAVLVAGVTVVAALRPTAIPLCFEPTVTASRAAANTAAGQLLMACPTGESLGRQPTGGDVFVVGLLGLLGGALAAAFSIRNIRGTSTPYAIPISLALLKVPSGALTAIAGLLLLSGEFVPGLAELDTQNQILAYALVLGYAQQIATHLVDQRAQSILDSVPSKDPESGQQTAITLPPGGEPPDGRAITIPRRDGGTQVSTAGTSSS